MYYVTSPKSPGELNITIAIVQMEEWKLKKLLSRMLLIAEP